MNMENKNIGVITEQGFVAGMGLGFTPTTLNEQKKDEKENNKNEDKK